jgi:TPR repeat protein
MQRRIVPNTAIAIVPAMAALAAAAQPVPAQTPQTYKNAPALIAAGYIDDHQDLKYRHLGLKAYREGRYEDAMRFFRRAGLFGDKPSQGMVAEMYRDGRGVAPDPVQAYIWMDLAAERGYPGFLILRERYWESLDDAQRARAVDEGQAVFARFGDAVAKPRTELRLRFAERQLARVQTVSVDGMTIDASKLRDKLFWDAKRHWAFQDVQWSAPGSGHVTVGEIESVDARSAGAPSDTDAQPPAVDAPEADGAGSPPRTP